jgi:hypothetical protein
MQKTYSLGTVNHVLAPSKDGNRAARNIILLPSEDHGSIFSSVVIGQKRQAQLFIRQLKSVCLQVRKSNHNPEEI